jgi:hypothetical protein
MKDREAQMTDQGVTTGTEAAGMTEAGAVMIGAGAVMTGTEEVKTGTPPEVATEVGTREHVAVGTGAEATGVGMIEQAVATEEAVAIEGAEDMMIEEAVVVEEAVDTMIE